MNTVEQRRRPGLIPPPGRPAAALVAVLALAGFVAMVAWLHGGRDPAGFDRPLDTWLQQHIGTSGAEVLLALSEPALTLGIAAAVALGALLVRRWDVAMLAAAGPTLTVFLGSVVLKPLIGRRFGMAQDLYGVSPGWAFPSGHEGTLCGTLAVLGVLVLRSSWRPGARAAVVGVLVVWALLGAVGLVRNRYHYTTDTVGSMLLALVIVPVLALAIDAVWARVSSPAARCPSSTPRGS